MLEEGDIFIYSIRILTPGNFDEGEIRRAINSLSFSN
jgi:hypothetical protein